MMEDMKKRGFINAMTGGGCTAFSYEFGDGTSEPSDMEVPIYIGLYSMDADSDFEECHEMENLADFLDIW